jgi:hypothetical protein
MNQDVPFISLGTSCIVKAVLRRNNKPPFEQMPFDTLGSGLPFVLDSLAENFCGWDDPSRYYVPKFEIMPSGTVNVGVHGYRITGFLHDLRPDDFDVDPKQCEGTKREEGFPIKEDSLHRFINKYQRMINDLRDLTRINERIVFVRWERDNYGPEQLFTALQDFCRYCKFTLLYIRQGAPEDEKMYDLSRSWPRLCMDIDGNQCFHGTIYTAHEVHRATVFQILDDILKGFSWEDNENCN